MSKHMTRIGAVILTLMVLLAVFAPVLSPHNPYASSTATYQLPSLEHPLGTNDIGQDILSEVIYGARTSLAIGFFSAAISLTIGTVLGLLSGWYGGWLDRLIAKLTAFMLTVPYLPTVIIISAFTKHSIYSTSLVLGIMSWAGTTRIVRTQTMAIREKDYIQTIRAMGASDYYIFSHHVIRELTPWLMYQFAGRVKSGILSESSLSFLGLGSTTQKSWGTMIYYAQEKNALLTGSWLWWIVPPGLCIILVSCALIMISYGFEEKTDRRLSR
ncbi:MAG: ABC transporter permease [Lachnospiraceae bacterium]|nr:ABC transporter permease [Lachnospiraceae bacterium]